MREGARVKAVGPYEDGGRTLTVQTKAGESQIRAQLVIGADGHHSVVAKGAGLLAARWQHRWPQRVGIMAHYEGVTTMDRYGAMVVGPRGFHGYSGIAPLGGGLTNVAFVVDMHAMKRRGMTMDAFFDAVCRCAAARARGARRGAARRARFTASGRWRRARAGRSRTACCSSVTRRSILIHSRARGV